MPNSESTLYLQEVNFESFVKEGVDFWTGQYNSSATFFEASKAHNCAPFKLSLRVSPLNTTDVGFGKG